MGGLNSSSSRTDVVCGSVRVTALSCLDIRAMVQVCASSVKNDEGRYLITGGSVKEATIRGLEEADR